MRSRPLHPGRSESENPAGRLRSKRSRPAGPPDSCGRPAPSGSGRKKVYRLIFSNKSTNAGSVCLYQAPIDVNISQTQSLVWLAKHSHPTTEVQFQWTLEPCFFWSSDRKIGRGSASFQILPGDLDRANRVTLRHDRAYHFIDQGMSEFPGILHIHQDRTIPLRQAWVGIGMSGAATHALEAQPNLHLAFSPKPDYWITFGQYKQGDRIDPAKIATAARVVFPPNVYTLEATLHEDNTWTITPAEGERRPKARKPRRAQKKKKGTGLPVPLHALRSVPV